jgi:predicted DNA binding protein
MANVRDTVNDGRDSGSRSVVRAQLAIRPDPASHCAVASAGDTRDVAHHLKNNCSGEQPGGCPECHTELELSGEDGRRAYLTSDVSENCVCPVFEAHDCIPEIREVRSGTLVVSLTVPRREVLREILTDLRAVDATVSVEWLVNGGDSGSVTEIDASAITDKQREAMEIALELGYYESPRETDLGELADELGISKSAVSQRLNAAETKLATAFLDDSEP